MSTVSALEARVFELEEIRVCVRASLHQPAGQYNYQRKAPGNMSLTEWLDTRVRPLCVGFEVYAINGRGEVVHGRTKLDNLRASYGE